MLLPREDGGRDRRAARLPFGGGVRLPRPSEVVGTPPAPYGGRGEHSELRGDPVSTGFLIF